MNPLALETQTHRPFIESRGSGLWVDGANVGQLVSQFGTPLYVTSLSAFAERVGHYKKALQSAFPSSRLYYALKANWGRPLVDALRAAGEGFDIVSAGELTHLLESGVTPALICFAGVGKTPEEIRLALESQVGMVNVEHLGELDVILNTLRQLRSTSKVALRLNPCVDVETHPHLRTGALDSKFGMRAEELLGALSSPSWRERLAQGDAAGVPLSQALRGVHVHVGSQLLKGTLLDAVVDSALALADALVALGLPIDHMDFGGGLGVPHSGVPHDGSDIKNHVEGLRQALHRCMERHPALKRCWGSDLQRVQICLEPGRSVVASSTIFLSKALYTRCNTAEHRFVYVDGGMNDFPRPSLYGARHDVVVAQQALDRSHEVAGGGGLSIVGPVCESADVLRRDPTPMELPRVAPGDVLGFFEAGAYCRSMASNYNLRPLPRTVYVEGGRIVWVDGSTP